MAVPVEQVQEGKCFRVKDGAPRRILRVHGGTVTWVPRGDNGSWTVLRYYEPVDYFAGLCEAEVDYFTLQDLAA